MQFIMYGKLNCADASKMVLEGEGGCLNKDFIWIYPHPTPPLKSFPWAHDIQIHTQTKIYKPSKIVCLNESTLPF